MLSRLSVRAATADTDDSDTDVLSVVTTEPWPKARAAKEQGRDGRQARCRSNELEAELKGMLGPANGFTL